MYGKKGLGKVYVWQNGLWKSLCMVKKGFGKIDIR